MTTVIAVQCKDGVVFCAEGEESDGLVKEDVVKIEQVGYNDKFDKYSLIGCSGLSDYIQPFERYIGESILNRGGNAYFNALDEAINNYSKYVLDRPDYVSLFGAQYPSAIFVGYAPELDKIQVYQLNPPRPPHEITKKPYRAVIGTGQRFSSSLFGAVEELMYWIDFDWTKLSTKLVLRFCSLVLGLVKTKDSGSGLSDIFYVFSGTEHRLLRNEEIFPGIDNKSTFRFPMLIDAVLDEIPRDKLLKLARMYDPNGVLLTKLNALLGDHSLS